jgi:ribose transport system permease protein
MSSNASVAVTWTRQRRLNAPLLLLVGSVALYVVVALVTRQPMMLHVDGIVGLLQRMVGLGIVAVGQTFAILAGSIDLSVANLISVAAVLASFIMQGRPEMMLPAVAAVLAVSATVGVVNGALISRLQVNPLIATLGVGLVLQGLLSASFTNFAGSVPPEFQALAYGAVGPAPYSVIGLFVLAFLASLLLRATKFGASLRGRRQCGGGAPRGHPHRSRDDRGACALQPLRRHDRPLSREPPSFRRALDRARWRL